LKNLRIYKYLPFSDGSLKILKDGKIKFTKPSEFNDPFDSSPDHESHNVEEFLDSYPDWFEKIAHAKKLSPEQLNCKKPVMINRLKTAIENGEFGQQFSDNVGICSLTRNPLNLLMWAHYSENHTGFVVEFVIPLESSFDPKKNPIKFMEWLIPQSVQYKTAKPMVSFLNDDNNTKMEKQFLIKSNDWRYEQEERVIDYIRGSGIHKYDQKKILHSVIAGMKMESPQYSILEKIVTNINKEKRLTIRLHRVAPVDGKFELFVPGRPDLIPLKHS